MSFQHSILFAASEMYPFSKSGGLGDVMGALPLTLKNMGHDVAVITPRYGHIKTRDYPLEPFLHRIPVDYPWPGITADIYFADYEGLPTYFVHRGEYFDRSGYYNTHDGDYFDNCERFIFFCKAVMSFCKIMERAPEVLHLHDWQAALVPAYLYFSRFNDSFFAHTKSIQTIHNLAFQGRYAFRLFRESGLPSYSWNLNGVEFEGDFNMLKAGIAYSDMVTTVSPSYAQEILSPEFGCGLEGILSKRENVLKGILNGADYSIWSPETDNFLPGNYSVDNLENKEACKENIFFELGLRPQYLDRPLLAFIGRLWEQKGIDLLISLIPALMEKNICLVILGQGKREYELALTQLAENFKGQLGAIVGYTEDLAHRIQAASDIFLMPSRYEPCGLTQIYSLRYGTPPVVSAVGGLRDTIIGFPNDNCTGFNFRIPTKERYESPESSLKKDLIARENFLRAIDVALEQWSDRRNWNVMVRRAMLMDFSWERAGQKYVQMYKDMGARI